MAPKETFHQRFGIAVDLKEAERRFLNRVRGKIFERFTDDFQLRTKKFISAVADRMGETYHTLNMSNYGQQPFLQTLEILEAFYYAVPDRETQSELERLIRHCLESSEIDLGIEWVDGQFRRKGAALLDENVVNVPLQWLAAPRFKNVYDPFSKGIKHYLEAIRRPELHYDVVTDMYEALEGLAKVVTQNQSKDLSGNYEQLLSRLNLSKKAKLMLRVTLKEYIAYCNSFRHALQEGHAREQLSEAETESFIYLTGTLIRLIISSAPSEP